MPWCIPTWGRRSTISSGSDTAKWDTQSQRDDKLLPRVASRGSGPSVAYMPLIDGGLDAEQAETGMRSGFWDMLRSTKRRMSLSCRVTDLHAALYDTCTQNTNV